MKKTLAPTWEELNRNTLVKVLMEYGYTAKYAVKVSRAVGAHEALLKMALAYFQTLPDDGPEQDHYAQILEKAGVEL